MKNITEMRDALIKNFEELEFSQENLNRIKEQTNISGKVIKTAALEMQYNILTDQKDKKIKFMETD